MGNRINKKEKIKIAKQDKKLFFITVNVQIFVVTLFGGLNFRGN